MVNSILNEKNLMPKFFVRNVLPKFWIESMEEFKAMNLRILSVKILNFFTPLRNVHSYVIVPKTREILGSLSMTEDPDDITSFKEQLKQIEFIPRPSLCCVLDSWIACKNCDWKLCFPCMDSGRPENMLHYATFLSHETYGCKENYQI